MAGLTLPSMIDGPQTRIESFLSFPVSLDSSLHEAIFQSLIDGVLVCDETGCCLEANKVACRIFCRTREELLGYRVGDLLEEHDGTKATWDRVIHGASLRAEVTVSLPEGRRRPLELTAVGNIRREQHMVVIREVNDRRSLEDPVHDAQKLEAAGRLAGEIAHDFNNLLMVITSYAEFIQDSLGEFDPLRKNTKEILKASSRAIQLTRQLLDFSLKERTERL